MCLVCRGNWKDSGFCRFDGFCFQELLLVEVVGAVFFLLPFVVPVFDLPIPVIACLSIGVSRGGNSMDDESSLLASWFIFSSSED